MAAAQVTLPPLPVDHSYSQQTEEEGQEGVEVYEEEEHHSWLGGSTAVKYLLAGGVAGAGEHVSSVASPLPPNRLVLSFTDGNRAIRPVEDLLDHPATRPISRPHVKITRYEGDHQRDNEDICRERSSWVLDREWSVCRKDPPRIRHQVSVIRILCKVFPRLKPYI